MDTVGPRVFLKEAGKWETIELRFLEIFLIPKQRWREFVIIRLVPCAWRSWLKQSSVPKEWPRGTWKEQKMVGGCCKRPFLFIIDLHWIIWNHESTTGALVCLLPANTTNQHHRYPPWTPLPLPPTTRPPETKLCPIILLCNGFTSLRPSFQWGGCFVDLGQNFHTWVQNPATKVFV